MVNGDSPTVLTAHPIQTGAHRSLVSMPALVVQASDLAVGEADMVPATAADPIDLADLVMEEMASGRSMESGLGIDQGTMMREVSSAVADGRVIEIETTSFARHKRPRSIRTQPARARRIPLLPITTDTILSIASDHAVCICEPLAVRPRAMRGRPSRLRITAHKISAQRPPAIAIGSDGPMPTG